MRSQSVKVLFATAALLSFAAPSMAASNLVQNGDFSQETDSSGNAINMSEQLVSPNASSGALIKNWTNAGYTFLFTPDATKTSGTTADNAGALYQTSNYLKLSGPGNGYNNGLTNSPVQANGTGGGNFIASDPNYQVGAISQVITGLVAGTTYQLSFWWAGAQQYNYSGGTSEQWQASLGDGTATSTYTTNTVTIAQGGFSGWQVATFIYRATSSTATLSFLALPPNGSPPFALLDNVSLTQVPEPATWGIVTAALAVVGFVSLRRTRRSVPTAA